MSDQKIDIEVEIAPFTMHDNIILQKILVDKLEALGLWSYLTSLPQNFSIYRWHIQKVCKIGERKLRSLLTILEDNGLVEVIQVRNGKGKFVTTKIKVFRSVKSNKKNTEIRADCPDIDVFEKSHNNYTDKHINTNEINDIDPPYLNAVAANRPVGNAGHINNINKNNISIKNTFADREDGDRILFDDFWKKYPRKEGNKPKTKNIWDKLKPSIQKLIMEDIGKRMMESAQWQTKQFIPYPSSYLNGQMWGNEIIPIAQKAQPITQKPAAQIRHYDDFTGISHEPIAVGSPPGGKSPKEYFSDMAKFYNKRK